MTVDQEVDIFLEHFGAKGMKWGVRKARGQKFDKSNEKTSVKLPRNLMTTIKLRGRSSKDFNNSTWEGKPVPFSKIKNSKSERVGQVATGAMLATLGVLTVAAIKSR